MGKLNIQLCPETGICSIIKDDGTKADLMPDEVDGLREASGKPQAIKALLAEVDSSFADSLGSDALDQLSDELKAPGKPAGSGT